MKRRRIIIVCFLFLLTGLVFLKFQYSKQVGINNTGKSISEARHYKKTALKLPLYFIKNEGVANERVKYLEKGRNRSVFFTTDEIIFSLINTKKDETFKKDNIYVERVSILPVGQKKDVEIEGTNLVRGKGNFFIGSDPKKWKTSVPLYSEIRYKEIYPKTDIVFYGNDTKMEYDIIAKPGADISKIVFEYRGIKELRYLNNGDVEAILPSGSKLIQRKPYVYQEENGKKREISGFYNIRYSEGRYILSFDIPEYRKELALVIDPIIDYSTYLGGSFIENNGKMAVDQNGNMYITGYTTSNNLPMKNPYDNTLDGADIFISKFDSTGQNLVFSTFLGGEKVDNPSGIALDFAGSVYIAGETNSANFPIVNGYQSTINGSSNDAFVLRLSSTGDSILYSTYFGGTDIDSAKAVAVHPTRYDVYITGYTNSNDLPVTRAIQPIFGGQTDVFVAAFKTTLVGLASLDFSTYLGGTESEAGWGIAVGNIGNIYVTGKTNSPNFPVAYALQSTFGGLSDAFVVKLAPDGQNFVYSTYLGGMNYDIGYGIATDSFGNAYITGMAQSTFPVKSPIQVNFNGEYDSFISVINPGGTSLTFSTYLGGASTDVGNSIVVGVDGKVYIAGYTSSLDFPVLRPVQSNLKGGMDAFVSVVDIKIPQLFFSSYLGGNGDEFAYSVCTDINNNFYIAGKTNSSDFPVKNPFQSTISSGEDDVFVVKFSPKSECFKPSDVVAWYRAENNADDNYGTYHGIPSDNIAYAQGMTGNAFSLNGSSEYVNIPNGIIPNTQKYFSVEAWVKPAAFGGKEQFIVYGGSTAGEYSLTIDGEGSYNFGIKFENGYWVNTYGSVKIGVWTHLVGVRRNSILELWINGSLEYSQTAYDTNMYATGDGMNNSRIGAYNEFTNQNLHFFDGLIDEVTLYNRALDQAEIEGLYNAYEAGKCFVEDLIPDRFVFPAVKDAEPDTVVISDTVTITGINSRAEIIIEDCTASMCEYMINNGQWTTSAGTVRNGDKISLRVRSSASFSSTVSMTIMVGSGLGIFEVTTLSENILDAGTDILEDTGTDVFPDSTLDAYEDIQIEDVVPDITAEDIITDTVVDDIAIEDVKSDIVITDISITDVIQDTDIIMDGGSTQTEVKKDEPPGCGCNIIE